MAKIEQLIDRQSKLMVFECLNDLANGYLRNVFDGLTNFFSCSHGVRQGCLPTPILFASFLNDLNEAISSKAKGIRFPEDMVHSLLHADDLILLAESGEDLRKQIDLLHDFTKQIQMSVNLNIGKTKIMVSRKHKRKIKSKQTWLFFGENEIQEYDSYKYLGVTIKSNCSFNEHVEIVKQKANQAYYSLISKSNDFDSLHPRLFLYLLDQTIAPILNYASEIWGHEELVTLERLHLSACKYIVGVKSTTCTDAVYAEL